MTLKEQINNDFIASFKAKQMEKKNFLGVIKGEIQTAESKKDFKGEDTVLSIVKKMEKSLKENAGLGDKRAETELGYIKPYIPTLMGEDEVRSIVGSIINDGATNIGMVMGGFSKNYRGKADNKLVSQIAKELLG